MILYPKVFILDLYIESGKRDPCLDLMPERHQYVIHMDDT